MKEKKQLKFVGLRVSAILEILIFLSLVCLASYLWGSNDRFINMELHPFWFILVLIIVQYNLPETLFCILMMIIFLYTDNVPIQGFRENTFDYYFSLCLQPILWLTIGLFVNGIRRRRIQKTDKLEENIENLKFKLKKISESYAILERKNINLESKIAKEMNSAVKIYNAAKNLDHMNSFNYIKIMEETILSMLPVKKFSLYFFDKDQNLVLKSSYGWSGNDIYNDKYLPNSNIYKKVINNRKTLYVARKKDEIILENQGILASSLIDLENDKILGMLKIESIDFKYLVSKNIELFKVLCQWLGISYNSFLYLEKAKENTIKTVDETIYSNNFMEHQLVFLKKLSKRANLNLTTIVIRINNINNIETELKHKAVIFLSKIINDNLRTTDQVFDKDYRSGSYLVVLPNTDIKGAKLVLSKIKIQLTDPEDKKLTVVNYSFEINNVNSYDETRKTNR